MLKDGKIDTEKMIKVNKSIRLKMKAAWKQFFFPNDQIESSLMINIMDKFCYYFKLTGLVKIGQNFH